MKVRVRLRSNVACEVAGVGRKNPGDTFDLEVPDANSLNPRIFEIVTPEAKKKSTTKKGGNRGS